MAWFSPEESPLAALWIDGVAWGSSVGVLGPLVGGVVSSVVQGEPDGLAGGVVVSILGALVGAVLGGVFGVAAGLVITVWHRLGASPGVAAVGTLVPVLVGPVVAASRGDASWLGAVITIVAVAALPLTLDVVRLVRRPSWRSRPSRAGDRCVLSTRRCVLVVR